MPDDMPATVDDPAFLSWFSSLPPNYQQAGTDALLRAYNNEYGWSSYAPGWKTVKVGAVTVGTQQYDVFLGSDGYPYATTPGGTPSPIPDNMLDIVEPWLDARWDEISARPSVRRLQTGTAAFTPEEVADPFIKWLIDSAGPEEAARALDEENGSSRAAYEQNYRLEAQNAKATTAMEQAEEARRVYSEGRNAQMNYVPPAPASTPAPELGAPADEDLPPWAAYSTNKMYYADQQAQIANGTWEYSLRQQQADYDRWLAGQRAASATTETLVVNPVAGGGNPTAGGGGGGTTGGGGSTGTTGTAGTPDIANMTPQQFLDWLLGKGTSGANVLNYKPDVWKGLPVYKYMTGQTDKEQFSNSPGGTTHIPALGIDIPAPSDMNYWKAQDLIENNPDDAAVWNSINKAGNRDWMADVARAKMRAPQGEYMSSDLIST